MLPYKFLRLPHKRQIGGGLSENSTIRLRGRTFEKPTEFSVSLACGEANKDDIPLHVRGEPRREKLFFATKDSSAWIPYSEVARDTRYFQPATDFDFTIEATRDCFKINLGESDQLEYEHKLPFHTIRFVVIDGDINLQEVSINGVDVNEEQNRIPISRQLPEKTSATRIIVKGVPVRAEPHRMAIDFSSEVPGNVEFHFNPRFYDTVLVRNTMLQNEWGAEERQLLAPFPFVYGVAFKLQFTFEDDFIHVRMNGNHLCKYQRRGNPRQEICKMNIFGSVVITKAEIL